ncbi:MAG: hypothetical protein NZ989_05170, partial [Bacteroidia bacterium]|nr:hypothetical protein [Bacteroidia bacterium]
TVNQRFIELRQDMEKRFELISLRLIELREDMNKRFEVMDKRFAELREDFDQRFRHIVWLVGGGVVLLSFLMTIYKFIR